MKTLLPSCLSFVQRRLCPNLMIALALVFTIPTVCRAADWEWCTPLEVRQIAFATQLATFPLKQGELDTVIGKRKLPHLGGSTDSEKKVFGLIALTAPDSPGGYYAARIYYDLTTERTPNDIPVHAVQILYVSPQKMIFIHEPDVVLPDTKKRMLERKLTPIRFAEFLYNEKTESLGEEAKP